MAEKEGIFKRDGVWYIRTDPITCGKLSTRKRTKKEALEVYHERKQEAQRRKTDPNYAASKASLVEWCDIFLERCEERGCSSATVRMYSEKLGHWIRFLGEGAAMSDLSQASVDRFVSSRRSDGVKEHTIHKECSSAVRMLKVAKRGGAWFGDLDTLVPEDVRPNYVPRERALKMAEVRVLVRTARPYVAALVAISTALGVRLSEAQKVAPSDFSRDLKTVRIRGTKTKASARTVPVLSTFAELVKLALPALPLGPYPSGPRNLYRDLGIDCRRNGVAYCTPNDLRRSHATILLEFGVSPDVVRRLLGHTSDAMVRQVYGRPDPEALRGLAEHEIGKDRDVSGTSARRRHRRPASSASRKSTKSKKGARTND